MNSECSEFRLLLPDLVDGHINALQQQRLDQHLNHCSDCSEHLTDLWQMQANASAWQDQRVPAWNRRQAFFPKSSWSPNLHWISSFASVLALVLVITSATIDTSNGFKIAFGAQGGLDDAAMTSLLAEFESKQNNRLTDTITTLSTQQVAANQLLLRTVMEMSREERKEELSNLLTVWGYAQDQRRLQTKESISVLLASQVEDRRDIEQINRLLRQASLEGSDL